MNTAEVVAFEYGYAHIIGNSPIMLFSLPVLFKNIDADSKVFSAAVSRDDRPPCLSAKLTDPTRPFLGVAGKIFQFLARDLLADVPAEIFKDLIGDRRLLAADLIQHVPSKRSVPIFISPHEDVLVRPDVYCFDTG